MKARPRSVENRVADALNHHFTFLGMTPVERIPVLGRTGPDLSINELRLVVDVKSRLEVPKSIFFPLSVPFSFDNLIAARLENFIALLDLDIDPAPLDFTSKVIRRYLDHMEAWTQAKCPNGVSVVILHRPEIPIGNCVVIIHSNSRRRLHDYTTKYRNHPLPTE